MLRGGQPVRNSPNTIAASGQPIYLLGSATNINATGQITGLTTAYNTVYTPNGVPSGVVLVYCFAQTGLTAGLYYGRWQSSTAINLYSDAAGTVPLSGITSAAYASATTEAVLAAVTIPANNMGPNGAIFTMSSTTWTTSANNKTTRHRFNANAGLGTNGTTNTGAPLMSLITNRGTTGSQLHMSNNGGFGGAAGQTNALSVDTTASTTVTLTGQLSNVIDSMCLEWYNVQLYTA